MNLFGTIPKDIQEYIFSYLDPRIYMRSRRCCHALSNLSVPWSTLICRSFSECMTILSSSQVHDIKSILIRQDEPPSEIHEVFLAQQGCKRRFDDENLDALALVLSKRLKSSNRISTLTIHGDIMSHCGLSMLFSFASFSHVSSLDLSASRHLDDDCINMISSSLALRSLVIRGCTSISDRGISYLEKQRLHRLCISHCRVTDRCFEHISRLTCLHTLDVSNCVSLTWHVLQFLPPQLKTLDISGLYFDDSQLADSLFYVRSLRDLNISHTTLLSIDTLCVLSLTTDIDNVYISNYAHVARVLGNSQDDLYFQIKDMNVLDVSRVVGCMKHSPFFT